MSVASTTLGRPNLASCFVQSFYLTTWKSVCRLQMKQAIGICLKRIRLPFLPDLSTAIVTPTVSFYKVGMHFPHGSRVRVVPRNLVSALEHHLALHVCIRDKTLTDSSASIFFARVRISYCSKQAIDHDSLLSCRGREDHDRSQTCRDTLTAGRKESIEANEALMTVNWSRIVAKSHA